MPRAVCTLLLNPQSGDETGRSRWRWRFQDPQLLQGQGFVMEQPQRIAAVIKSKID